MSVGLDIGSKTIKVVELVRDGDKYTLKSAGIVGYVGQPMESISPENEKELVNLVEAIKKLFKNTKVSSKDVSVALPESQVFTRPIKFPMLTDQEVSAAVKWEAEQYIPIPVKEAVVQHQILERREDTSPPEVLVLLVASPRVLVEKYIKVLNMAGLNPTVIETELMSLVRSLAPAGQTVLLIDFGARSTDLAIAKDRALAFSRSIQTAGEAFTRAVAQSLSITPKQAEEYKRTYGLSGTQLEAKVKSAIDPVFRIVVDEIKKAVHFYQTEEKGEAPSSIILSGGTAGLPEAVSYLTKLLGSEVIIGNPFSKIYVDSDTLKNLSAYAPLYSIAAGLALRE
ncbi:type IV pilus assembly protein PilM [Candidatus Woesebacteria bacterium]|nr:type IV pilus assembly protein PilM [Candidatus Woesebacteria bacterium]